MTGFDRSRAHNKFWSGDALLRRHVAPHRGATLVGPTQRTVKLVAVLEEAKANMGIFGVDEASRRWLGGAKPLGLDRLLAELARDLRSWRVAQDGRRYEVARQPGTESSAHLRLAYAPPRAATPSVFAFLLAGRLARAFPGFAFDVGPRAL